MRGAAAVAGTIVARPRVGLGPVADPQGRAGCQRRAGDDREAHEISRWLLLVEHTGTSASTGPSCASRPGDQARLASLSRNTRNYEGSAPLSATMASVWLSDSSASFGELLRDHRRAAGLTQEELAERAGVSPRSISELERGGAHIPRRDTVALLVARARAGRQLTAEPSRHWSSAGAAPPRPTLESDELPVRAAVASTRRATRTQPAAVVDQLRRPRARARRARAGAPDGAAVDARRCGRRRQNASGAGARPQSLRQLCRRRLAGGTGRHLPTHRWCPAPSPPRSGLRDIHARNIASTLSEYLEPKRLLLVLDNCEHLIGACAELVAQLAARLPALAGPGHQPRAAGNRRRDHLAGAAARACPICASRTRPSRSRAPPRCGCSSSAPAPSTTTLVAHRRTTPRRSRASAYGVDGIPLALELAAARARVLTMEQLAERLEYDSTLLAARAEPGGLPQHQTIRATIDWSHDLLGEQEQVLLRRLSVFAGGWTLETGGGGVLGLGHRARRLCWTCSRSSWTSRWPGGRAHTRWRAIACSSRSASTRWSGWKPRARPARYRARHAAALLELAETGEADLCRDPTRSPSLERLEVEHDNIRAALRWALIQPGQPGGAARVGGAVPLLGTPRTLSGRLRLARRGPGQPPATPRPATAVGRSTPWQLCAGEAVTPTRAQPIAEQALAVSREAGDTRGVAWALLNLGMIAYFQDTRRTGPGLAGGERAVRATGRPRCHC